MDDEELRRVMIKAVLKRIREIKAQMNESKGAKTDNRYQTKELTMAEMLMESGGDMTEINCIVLAQPMDIPVVMSFTLMKDKDDKHTTILHVDLDKATDLVKGLAIVLDGENMRLDHDIHNDKVDGERLADLYTVNRICTHVVCAAMIAEHETAKKKLDRAEGVMRLRMPTVATESLMRLLGTNAEEITNIGELDEKPGEPTLH